MIVAGFGFRGEATVASLQDAHRLACGDITPMMLATAADKAHTTAFQTFALDTELPVRAVPPDMMEKQVTQSQSAASQSARQTGSVAEAAALAAAGPGARLLGPRVVSGDRMATCALAMGDGA